jgi:hypothetical protein
VETYLSISAILFTAENAEFAEKQFEAVFNYPKKSLRSQRALRLIKKESVCKKQPGGLKLWRW